MRFKIVVVSLLSILLGIPLLANNDCLKPIKLSPVGRNQALEADYAKSVFIYRGGTAYFIGGDPGFLLTANHVVLAPHSEDRACSPFISSESSTATCYKVKLKSEFRELDLAVLELIEPIPNSVKPISISTESVESIEPIFKIFGYSKRSESTERNFSIVPASVPQAGRVTAKLGKVSLNELYIYHINGSQYPGASGGPLVDKSGYAWATVVRGVDSFHQAYGVPHTSPKFVKWLLENTAPSKLAMDWIRKIKESSDLQVTKDEFSCALDIRRRELSSIDILHIGKSLRETHSKIFNVLSLDPLVKASGANINWNTVAEITKNPNSLQEMATLAEVQKEVTYQLALVEIDSVAKNQLLTRSAKYGVAAAGYLIDIIPANESAIALSPIQAGTITNFSGAHQAVSELNDESRLRARISTNLQDASRTYAASWKLSNSSSSFSSFLETTALGVSVQGVGRAGYGFVHEILAPVGYSEDYGKFKSGIEIGARTSNFAPLFEETSRLSTGLINSPLEM